jgi:hypothetical protein
MLSIEDFTPRVEQIEFITNDFKSLLAYIEELKKFRDAMMKLKS